MEAFARAGAAAHEAPGVRIVVASKFSECKRKEEDNKPMNTTYSAEFKEQALRKVFARGSRSIREVAEELNMNHLTLKGWMKSKLPEAVPGAAKRERRPEDWRREERLAALQESHGLEGEGLNAWCRERGLFAHQLDGWKRDFCREPAGAGEASANARELRVLRERNQCLQRELARKEKALAEAAALLVLQKKYRALLGEGEE
jgi:transposase-like protein